MNLPLVDLQRQRHSIADELQPVIDAVLDHCHFVGGPEVGQFEEAFASLCGVDHCVGVGNGTDALFLALLALGIGPGDEVITTPFSFVASTNVILHVGATPVFVDIDPQTSSMDVRRHNSLNEGGHPCPSLWSPRGSRVSTEPRGRPSHYCH